MSKLTSLKPRLRRAVSALVKAVADSPKPADLALASCIVGHCGSRHCDCDRCDLVHTVFAVGRREGLREAREAVQAVLSDEASDQSDWDIVNSIKRLETTNG